MEDGDKMADYLVLVGDDQLSFWQVETGAHCIVSVPFRVCITQIANIQIVYYGLLD